MIQMEILEREASRPPADEIVERVARRSAVDLGKSAAELLREERRERGLTLGPGLRGLR